MYCHIFLFNMVLSRIIQSIYNACVIHSLSLSLSLPSLPSPPLLSSLSSRNFEKPLEDSNVGHQMLKKMGWEGAGLGVEEQGIQEPIKGGEVRDKVDKYKVGVVMS